MELLLLFILVVIGLNCMPFLTKIKSPKLEKVITRTLLCTLILFLISTVLWFNGHRLKGIYTDLTIKLVFILSCILFFAIIRNTKKKVIITVFTTPLLLLSLFVTVLGLGQVIAEYKINDTYKIEVSGGGLLACGEIIHITKSEFGIFHKTIYYESSLCLIGIEKIETLEFNKNHAEFLIYHNGKYDSENPYRYKVENENWW